MSSWEPSEDPLVAAERANAQSWEHCRASLQQLIAPGPLMDQVKMLGGGECPLDLMENDYQFVKRYGLTIDGFHFDFDHRYKHLTPIYEDTWPFQTLMAGAQTGKTARLLVHLARTMCLNWGALFGYYFPDIHLPKAFSSQRLKPFLMSNPDLGRLLGAPKKSGKGTDNVLTRTLGESTLFLMTTRGKSSTEGLPLKGVYFDEVRRMEMGDIERAMERYSAQIDPLDIKVSTARYPESDIHRFFLEGDQRFFHTDCACAEGVVLSLEFPNCVADLRGATPMLKNKVAHAHRHISPDLGRSAAPVGQFVEAAYICPTCGTIIADPREGWWEPHAADDDGLRPHSYQMPQLLSPTYPAGRVLHKTEKTQDVQELHNSMIGMPYIDDSKRGTTEAHILQCVNMDIEWAANRSADWRKQWVANTCAGVDVQAGYLVVTIKMLAPNGKYRLIHLKIVHGHHPSDPWHSMGKIMNKWDIRCAVIDQAPEWSAALRFAQAFRGRVYLANFNTNDKSQNMITWGDVGTKRGEKGKDAKNRYRVNIEKVKGMKWSLGRWEARTNEMPDPRGLIQKLPMSGDRMAWSAELRAGRKTYTRIAPIYMRNLTNIVYRDIYEGKEDKERQGEHKIVVETLGADHFADANLYCDVALSRFGSRARPRRI